MIEVLIEKIALASTAAACPQNFNAKFAHSLVIYNHIIKGIISEDF